MKLLGFLTAFLLCAASPDPFIGVWRLNASKSQYASGQCPKAMTIEMTPAGKGVRYQSETEFVGGRRSNTSYTAAYDGPESMVTGSSGLQTPVVLKRLDVRTVEADYVRNLQVVASSRRVVSADGRFMTITTVSRDKNGKELTNIGVYEKAAPAPSSFAP